MNRAYHSRAFRFRLDAPAREVAPRIPRIAAAPYAPGPANHVGDFVPPSLRRKHATMNCDGLCRPQAHEWTEVPGERTGPAKPVQAGVLQQASSAILVVKDIIEVALIL